MTRNAAAIALGNDRNFFVHMKKDKLAYVEALQGDTLVDKYKAYEAEVLDVVTRYSRIPYTLEDIGMSVAEFGRLVVAHKIYKHTASMYSQLYIHSPNFGTFIKMKKILDLLETL